MQNEPFDFSLLEKERMQSATMQAIAKYLNETRDLPVANTPRKAKVEDFVGKWDFSEPLEIEAAIASVEEGLRRFAVHTPHPRYFGLFNPRANYPAILADLMTAAFNPQLATWSHAAFAVEVEQNLIKQIAGKFGYREAERNGTFTSGGAESNLTALICALNHHLPGYRETGLLAQNGRPVVYCSAESHHSLHRAARTTGLGLSAVRQIPVDLYQQIDLQQLELQIQADITAGLRPIMVVGTAGTTGSGAIDRLCKLAVICRRYNLWYHVDAAYGGAAAFSDQYRHLLSGIERSDSITLDIHKWLSVPMGASVFVTRNTEVLRRSFDIKTEYMPADDPEEVVNPYTHSLQWSRRFIGLKLHLPLLIYGWRGIAAQIDRQVELAEELRSMLRETGWEIRNQSLFTCYMLHASWLA